MMQKAARGSQKTEKPKFYSDYDRDKQSKQEVVLAQSARLFAAVMTGGIVPGTDNPQLLAALSLMGNSAFSALLEKTYAHDRTHKALRSQNIRETAETETILSVLAGQSGKDQENRLDGWREFPQYTAKSGSPAQLPPAVGNDDLFLSALAPVELGAILNHE